MKYDLHHILPFSPEAKTANHSLGIFPEISPMYSPYRERERSLSPGQGHTLFTLLCDLVLFT